MKRYTQKELKNFVNLGVAVDITNGTNETRKEILAKENDLEKVGYSSGIYGCNGLLLKGYKTGTLYAVCSRSTAIFIFG